MGTLYGLETEARYFIVVQARNVKGTSDMSSLVTVTTKPGSESRVPDNRPQRL